MENETIIFKNSILQKVFSLRQLSVHELSRKLWGDLTARQYLEGDPNGGNPSYMKVLYQNCFSDGVFEQILPSFNAAFKDQLRQADVQLEQGFVEAIAWQSKYRNPMPFAIFNPLIAGSYWPGYYITPAGQFDDFTFAKRYVADNAQPPLNRFKLAGFYCFEHVLQNLWHTTEARNICLQSIAAENRMDDIGALEHEMLNLYEWWVLWFEMGRPYWREGYYVLGLQIALQNCFEHGVSYFWEFLSLPEKNGFLLDYFESMTTAGMYTEVRFVHCLYSLLTTEQRNSLFSWIAENEEAEFIWFCLFHSPFAGSVINDILTFPYSIPALCYDKIFDAIIFLMEKQNVHSHRETFKILWQHITPDEKREMSCDNIFESLVVLEDNELLDYFVASFSSPDRGGMDDEEGMDLQPE